MQYFEMSPLPLASNMGVPASGGTGVVYNRQGGANTKQTNLNTSYYYGAYYNPQTASMGGGVSESFDNKTGGAYNISGGVGGVNNAVGGTYQQQISGGGGDKGGVGNGNRAGGGARASSNSVENHFGPPTETLSMYENGKWREIIILINMLFPTESPFLHIMLPKIQNISK